MNSRKIIEYTPSIYAGFKEYETIIQVCDDLLDNLEKAVDDLKSDQFILSATEEGITQYEEMLKITANTSTETLEFRRERLINRLSTMPPFTIRFLRNKLAEILGEGKFIAYVDYANYTIYVESAVENQTWFDEIMITMVNIKPANMIFINKPLISAAMALSEEISYGTRSFNYALGYWSLGQAPFATYKSGGMIKLSTVSSLKSALFQDVAQLTASDIASVLINNTLSISQFSTKQAAGNECVIEYSVPQNSVQNITSIKLLDARGNTLSESVVYVPVAADVVLKHTIKVKEA